MKKILAAGWWTGSANALVPVLKKITAEGTYALSVVAEEPAESVLRSAKLDYCIPEQKSHDVSVDALAGIIEQEQPSLVLTGSAVQDKDHRDVLEQNILAAAKRSGIPSIALLDTWGNYAERFSDKYSKEKFQFLPDMIAAMDQYSKEGLIDAGCSSDRILVTGNPFFDDLITQKEKFTEDDKSNVRTAFNVTPEMKLILFASQNVEYHYGTSLGYTQRSVLEELITAVEQSKDRGKTKVVIRAHPRESFAELLGVAGYSTFPIEVTNTYPTRELVLASDIVVSMFSTVLVESSYLDKPSISLQPNLRLPDMLKLNKLGVTVPVYKSGEIGSIIDRIIHDESYRNELAQKRKTFQTDGKATERVCNLIEEMLR